MVENFWRVVSRWVPERLVYHCAIRLCAHATTGKWGHQEVPALSFMTALKRWEEK